MSFPFVIPP